MKLTALALLALPFLAACIGDKGDASTATTGSTPSADMTSTVTPATSVESTSDPGPAPLHEVYDPQRFDSPAIYPQCCVRMDFPTRIAPPSLGAANAEGDLYLEGARSTAPFPGVFEGVPGTSELTCVDAAEANEQQRLRSGDFVLDLERWGAPEFEFVVFPRLIYDRGVFLRATRLDDSDEPATHFHQLDAAPELEATTSYSLFRASLVLPEAGEWLVVVTAGSQWGCFTVDAPEPPAPHTPVSSVAEAEERALSYPAEPAPGYVSPGFLADRGPGVRHPEAPWTMRGSDERRCLDITGAHDARSGEWIVRPAWAPFSDANPRSPGTKVLFIPLHQPTGREEADRWVGTPRLHLRVSATFLDAPQHTHVYEQHRWNARTGSEEAGTFELQHVAGTIMPRGDGDWLVVVTDGLHGTQWGCFLAPEGLSDAVP